MNFSYYVLVTLKNILQMRTLHSLTLAAVPLAAASLASCSNQKQEQPKQPNIVYIMCDDHAIQAISAYGNPISKLAPTPNIDRLAQRGMLFRNCFVENSLSAPSRACLITGEYSHQNGQRQLAEGIDSTQTFFTEILQEAGYQTGIVGKWHLMCTPKGFDYWHILDDQGKYYNPTFKDCSNPAAGYVQEMGYATDLITDHCIDFLENRDPNKPFCLMMHHKAPHRNWCPAPEFVGKYADVTFPVPATFYDDYATRGSAAHTQKMSIIEDMELIQDLKVSELLDERDPALKASYGSLMGELNRMTPEERANWDAYYVPRNEAFIKAKLKGKELAEWKYQNYLRDYMAVIQSVDKSVGRLLDYLDEKGLTENTIIVYTSDQGFYMGEHGWFDKRFMYEESMHTPLIISYPGHIKAGSENSQLVQNIDFAPTFLSLAGAKQPAQMTGRTLEPLFSGEPVEDWRQSLYYHYYDYPTFHLVRKHDGVRTERYKLIHFYGKGGMEGAATNKYQMQEGTREYNVLQYLQKANYFDQNDQEVNYNELYDLANDPNELHNIYGQPGTEQVTAELQHLLDDYRKSLHVDEY